MLKGEIVKMTIMNEKTFTVGNVFVATGATQGTETYFVQIGGVENEERFIFWTWEHLSQPHSLSLFETAKEMIFQMPDDEKVWMHVSEMMDLIDATVELLDHPSPASRKKVLSQSIQSSLAYIDDQTCLVQGVQKINDIAAQLDQEQNPLAMDLYFAVCSLLAGEGMLRQYVKLDTLTVLEEMKMVVSEDQLEHIVEGVEYWVYNKIKDHIKSSAEAVRELRPADSYAGILDREQNPDLYDRNGEYILDIDLDPCELYDRNGEFIPLSALIPVR